MVKFFRKPTPVQAIQYFGIGTALAFILAMASALFVKFDANTDFAAVCSTMNPADGFVLRYKGFLWERECFAQSQSDEVVSHIFSIATDERIRRQHLNSRVALNTRLGRILITAHEQLKVPPHSSDAPMVDSATSTGLGEWRVCASYGWPIRCASADIIGSSVIDTGKVIHGFQPQLGSGGGSSSKMFATILPYCPLWGGVLVDGLFVGTMLMLMSRMAEYLVHAYRRNRGKCGNCGYDLSYATGFKCTECGWTTTRSSVS